MTAQHHDTVTWGGDEFDLVGVRGRHLPVPEDFGITVRGVQSSCWRGFTVAYAFRAKRMRLERMTVCGAADDCPTVAEARIACVMPLGWPSYRSPRPASHRDWRPGPVLHTYLVVFAGRAVPFWGQLLLARGFDSSRYVHMGFQSPSAFRDVRLLTLRAGRILQARVLTRSQVERCSRPKDAGGSGGAVDWIRACFTLDFADPGDDD